MKLYNNYTIALYDYTFFFKLYLLIYYLLTRIIIYSSRNRRGKNVFRQI